jgi:hypothetical protein
MRMTPDDVEKIDDDIMMEMVVLLHEEGYTNEEIMKLSNYNYTELGINNAIKEWYS